MASPSNPPPSAHPDPDTLPFAAPCRSLALDAPLRWLRLGWRDLWRAPCQSLGYGLFFLVVSYLISVLAWEFGKLIGLVVMLSGFIFLGPVLAIGLYSISYQLQQGLRPRIGYCMREGKRHLGNEMIFALILLIMFLVWARAASMVNIFFPVEAPPSIGELALFLGVGSAVGSIFAAIIFAAAAFSLPMIMDRQVDMVTAVVTSINAVLRNKAAMLFWAVLIVGCVALSFVTAFLGLTLLLPLIGHATWHAYREAIDASAWPRHEQS